MEKFFRVTASKRRKVNRTSVEGQTAIIVTHELSLHPVERGLQAKRTLLMDLTAGESPGPEWMLFQRLEAPIQDVLATVPGTEGQN
ncbi:MAG: hypothetical protein JKY65_12105 [Planctomycetes bacterium]|nr:hypothetical protein [Planctomycetota bacterium]